MPLIRPLADRDWDAVRRIYAQGIETRNATFETQVAPAQDLDRRWITGQRWVADDEGRVLGWAAMTAVSSRACYRGVAETSVYVDTGATGQGLGTLLVTHQVRAAEEAGYWTLQTSIFPENEASLAVHRRAGFRQVGRRERIAQLDGVWRDTVLLERRSQR